MVIRYTHVFFFFNLFIFSFSSEPVSFFLCFAQCLSSKSPFFLFSYFIYFVSLSLRLSFIIEKMLIIL